MSIEKSYFRFSCHYVPDNTFGDGEHELHIDMDIEHDINTVDLARFFRSFALACGYQSSSIEDGLRAIAEEYANTGEDE